MNCGKFVHKSAPNDRWKSSKPSKLIQCNAERFTGDKLLKLSDESCAKLKENHSWIAVWSGNQSRSVFACARCLNLVDGMQYSTQTSTDIDFFFTCCSICVEYSVSL